MKFNDHQPIYIQIMDYFKFKIIRGELQSNEKVPSIRDVSSQLKVNPNTVQRSFQELKNEGIIYSQRGLGNFVTSDEQVLRNLKVIKGKEIISNFYNEITSLGLSEEDCFDLLREEWNRREQSN
ncbi:MAG: GntR family transcriptional regulator [Lagierella massiliensis]|nr:GntR family transcriptional regulator [Lagierella massiliensis]